MKYKSIFLIQLLRIHSCKTGNQPVVMACDDKAARVPPSFSPILCIIFLRGANLSKQKIFHVGATKINNHSLNRGPRRLRTEIQENEKRALLSLYTF